MFSRLDFSIAWPNEALGSHVSLAYALESRGRGSLLRGQADTTQEVVEARVRAQRIQ